MDAQVAYQPALKRATAAVLRPLFKLLLRHAISFGAFEEIAKRVYIEVAMKDFGIPGKKPSISRASILSGLTRKEVQRLASEPEDVAVETNDRYNRAARVLTAWVRDAEFTDSKGKPRFLGVDGDLGFAGLVKRHSGDMPVRAMLDELIRVGAVVQHGDGRLELITRAYVPQRSAVDKIGILGTDVASLVDTIDHNLQHGETDPRFQRKVMYNSIPVDALEAFRKLSTAHSQSLLEKLDRWLAQHDTDIDPASTEPRARVGLGIYYFEDRSMPATGKTGTP
jgi:hypothetical protein